MFQWNQTQSVPATRNTDTHGFSLPHARCANIDNNLNITVTHKQCDLNYPILIRNMPLTIVYKKKQFKVIWKCLPSIPVISSYAKEYNRIINLGQFNRIKKKIASNRL